MRAAASPGVHILVRRCKLVPVSALELPARSWAYTACLWHSCTGCSPELHVGGCQQGPHPKQRSPCMKTGVPPCLQP